MLDVKELEKTKRVNIVGEIPDVRLQILDNNGKIKEFLNNAEYNQKRIPCCSHLSNTHDLCYN